MSQRPRILVVEDEPAIAELIAVNLTCATAGSSRSARPMAPPPSTRSMPCCPT